MAPGGYVPALALAVLFRQGRATQTPKSCILAKVVWAANTTQLHTPQQWLLAPSTIRSLAVSVDTLAATQ